jgi:hypothetical protein
MQGYTQTQTNSESHTSSQLEPIGNREPDWQVGEMWVASPPLSHERLPEEQPILNNSEYVDATQDHISVPQNLSTQPPTLQEHASFTNNLSNRHMDSLESTAPTSGGMVEDVLYNPNRSPEMNNADGISEWSWTLAKSQKMVNFLMRYPHAYEVCSGVLDEPQVTASMVEQHWKCIATLQNAGIYLYEAIRIDWDHYNLGTEPPLWERDKDYLHNCASQILDERPLSISDLCHEMEFSPSAMRTFLEHFPCFINAADGHNFVHDPHRRLTTQPHSAETPLLISKQSKCGTCTRKQWRCHWSDDAPDCVACTRHQYRCLPPTSKDRGIVEQKKRRKNTKSTAIPP